MPANIYKSKEGKRVPGVTTVIGQNLGWNKQALMWWANQVGLDGMSHRDASQQAADIGTIAHAMVEAELKGKKYEDMVNLKGVTKEQLDQAENSYLAWLEWAETVNFKLLKSEHTLVSEKYQFGGQIDVAAIKKQTCIIDLKTSKDVYPDMKIQLSAYGQLWVENYPDDPVKAYYLLRIGKDGGFSYHYWPDLSSAWEAFLCLRRLHDIQKKLK